MEPLDAVVVGSDEVWNFRHPWYAGYPAFFGEGLNARRLVAYAASFGHHDARDGIHPRWRRRLERFAAIAVRDDNSRELIGRCLGREPPLVLDPCLLFEELCEAGEEGEGPVDARPAVVYGHSFPEGFGAAVRAWAGARGLRLVSVGYRNDWADEQWLSAGPYEFARAVAGARAVVTNFFHGCVFALVNRKPFACAVSDYRSHKVVALAGAVDARARLVAAEPDAAALEAALDRPLEPGIAERLRALRRRSEAYLDQALA